MLLCAALLAGSVRVAPAPPGEPLSRAFSVAVEGRSVPVYPARVASHDVERRDRAMADFRRSGEAYDVAAFASFDVAGGASVTVSCPEAVRSFRILPTSAGVVATARGKRLTFHLDRPRLLTVEVNGDAYGSLHLFANPLERDAPRPTDPDVVYFGPGVHRITHLVVPDGKTLYVADGAILRCEVGKDEEGWAGGDGARGYPASIELLGKHVAIRGRGIVDGSALPPHSRNLVFVRGQDASVEGVVLRDAPTWNLPIRQSDRVRVENVKVLGYRANSDGIDVCNSRDVTVEGCFLRTLDDLIVVKTDQGQGPVRRVRVRRCVLWNQVAHALSVGAELREPVDDVRFEDCDVIHDTGREWTLRIFHCDSATVSNVAFDGIRVEETKRLLSLWIGETGWSKGRDRGRIRNVLVRNVRAAGGRPRIEVLGFDETHAVENVALQGVVLGGRPIGVADVETNAFVRGLAVRP